LQSLLEKSERDQIIDYCFKRYGLDPLVWEGLVLKKSSEAIWAVPSQLDAFVIKFSTDGCETAGLRIFSGKRFPYKITDSFLSFFSDSISNGVLLLNAQQTKSLLFEKSIESDFFKSLEDGYTVLKYRDLFLGVGLLRGSKLDSQIPKKITNQLSSKLELSDK